MSLFGCATLALVLASIVVPRASHAQQAAALSPPHCTAPYVLREAYAGDRKCVMPPRRDAVRAENALAASRVAPGGGAYGPDTCISGYVWRNASPEDHVCVLPGSRDIAAQENAGPVRPPQPAQPARPPLPACGTPDSCNRQAAVVRQRAAALRQRLAQRQRDLAGVNDERRKAEAQLREEDAKWMRENPGLGRSSQPSIADNVTPITRDIRQIEAALKAAEQESAKLLAAARPPAPDAARGR
jgi:hypothetical protein